ncbi:MAG: lamin tail domain-containing protein [Opitutales bacterium]
MRLLVGLPLVAHVLTLAALSPSHADLADSVLVFNEVQYHPADSADTEWVELRNLNGVDVDISGWRLDGGIEFTFPEATVVPGHGLIVVAGDPSDPTLAGVGAYGPFSGRLANDGEEIRIEDRNGRRMNVLDYGGGDLWPEEADGSDATLVRLDETQAGNQPESWSWSRTLGGTPGQPNFPSPPPSPGVVINEVAAYRTTFFQLELTNLGATAEQLEGWILRSSVAGRPDYVFPALELAPGDFVAVTADDFGYSPVDGERIFLLSPGADQVLDGREVTGSLRGRVSGGWRDGRWLYPAAPTFGSANVFVFNDAVVFNEIMYHPSPRYETTEGTPFQGSEAEWIELHNRGNSTVDLSGWVFTDGIQFEFPAGTTVPAGGFIVLARDPAALQAEHPGLSIVGPWDGNLSRAGERLVLEDAAENPTDILHYHDGGDWHPRADGEGSSLELRDPRADNAHADAWAPSEESHRGQWKTFTWRGTATNGLDDPSEWNEFVFGLLDEGEFLIDDISVIEDPDGAARQLIQNGDFSGGRTTAWRLLGNHRRAEVVPDPDDPSNSVLRIESTGPTGHMHNHAETTLKHGGAYVEIDGSETYEISLRARWISGSPRLHARLYFNRLARTCLLPILDGGGTPGAPNSVLPTGDTGVGPTHRDLAHAPAVPAAGEPAVVSVRPHDPDGLDSLTLRYSVNGAAWQSAAMADRGDGVWEGTVPAQSAGAVVQFHIEALDTTGAASTFPAMGEDARALIPWDDGEADLDYGDCQPNNFRLVMTQADKNWLHTLTNVMSNDWMRGTVIYNESEVYHNIRVRLRGSQHGRAVNDRMSYNLRFPPYQLFLGTHEAVVIDRSGAGDEFSQKEIMVRHGIARAGGVPAHYDDLVRVIASKNASVSYTGSAMLMKARYDDEFLENTYDDGDEGGLFEYELIYFPQSTIDGTLEGLKKPTPPRGVRGVDIRDLGGSDKELYRWHFLIKHNRSADDYSQLVPFAQAMGQSSGPAFDNEIGDYIDVDQWLRAFAALVLFGVEDNYAIGFGGSARPGTQHNLFIYFRPSDGRALFMPWDMDFTFEAPVDLPILNHAKISPDLQKLAADPAKKRAYYGHIVDIVQTSFNTAYLTDWAEHYSCFLPGENLTTHLAYINTRAAHALAEIEADIPPVAFAITTPDGTTTDETSVTLTGTGWVDVRELRTSGSGAPIPVEWTDADTWSASVPVDLGSNTITIEAFDHSGALLGSDTVQITGTVPVVPADSTNLVVSEFHYHPADPSASEIAAGHDDDNDFEFVEILNVGQDIVDLSDVIFADGVEFSFGGSAVTSLAPGARVLVVQDKAAFLFRYGSGLEPQVAGSFASGKLSNGGERIEIASLTEGSIFVVDYDDGSPWPESPDGDGPSLVLVDPFGGPDGTLPEYWRPSNWIGGQPGEPDDPAYPDYAAASFTPAEFLDPGISGPGVDSDNDGAANLIEYAAGTDPASPASSPNLKAGLLTDGGDEEFLVIRLGIPAMRGDLIYEAEWSDQLLEWFDNTQPGGPFTTEHSLSPLDNGDDTSTLIFRTTESVDDSSTQFIRLRVRIRDDL